MLFHIWFFTFPGKMTPLQHNFVRVQRNQTKYQFFARIANWFRLTKFWKIKNSTYSISGALFCDVMKSFMFAKVECLCILVLGYSTSTTFICCPNDINPKIFVFWLLNISDIFGVFGGTISLDNFELNDCFYSFPKFQQTVELPQIKSTNSLNQSKSCS